MKTTFNKLNFLDLNNDETKDEVIKGILNQVVLRGV